MRNSSKKVCFLMYGYLRIEPEILFNLSNKENLRNIIRKCSNKAYQDLKRIVPYKYSIKDMNKLSFEKRKEYKLLKQSYLFEIEQKILEGLSDLENINPSKIISEILSVQCFEKYIDLFKENKRFTVGMAQKWVNMTLKYLWIIDVLDDNSAKVLDAPIDSKIINKLSKMKIDIKARKWSDWDDFDEYIRIQDELRKKILNCNITRIQWENEQWMKK